MPTSYGEGVWDGSAGSEETGEREKEKLGAQTTASSSSAGVPQKRVRFDDDEDDDDDVEDDVAYGNVLDDDQLESFLRLHLELREFLNMC